MISIVTCFDEPYADSSSLPTMLVSQMASKYSTVILSGEGGDELFHGYGAYQWANRLSNPILSICRKPLSGLLNILPNRYKRISKLLDYNKSTFIPAHIFSQEQYFFTENELELLINQDFNNISPKLHNFFRKSENLNGSSFRQLNKRNLSSTELQAFYDLQFSLPGDLLTKIDRATMKYSIEGRVPLLDHRIIEFALNLDQNLKYRNGESKYLLKKILFSHVPEEYFNRPKQGFALPIKSWLQNELKFLIDVYLNKNTIEEYGIFNSKYVNTIIKSFYNGNDFLFNRIWSLIIMQLWMKNIYKN